MDAARNTQEFKLLGKRVPSFYDPSPSHLTDCLVAQRFSVRTFRHWFRQLNGNSASLATVRTVECHYRVSNRRRTREQIKDNPVASRAELYEVLKKP
ncbi:hypothetical protein [Ornithinimicrobium kibberense]|uniref:hypothetical protein n=1 Tax=Ornithinimicrobium kibberense TaxID=282060 RepID=UPI003610C2B7